MTRTSVETTNGALEIELEQTWCRLSAWAREVWLTDTGRLVRPEIAAIHSGDVELVGTYTKSMPLERFRADVFEAFEILRKRGAHAR